MKSIWKISMFDLKVAKSKIIGWSVSIFAIMFLYMILFPSVKGMVQIKFDALPEEMMQFVGMEDMSAMDTFTGYFTMIYNLIMIAISIFAVTFSAGVLQREEKGKTIEFLYSLELSRTEIYISKLITSIVAVAIVVISAGVSTVVCGAINGGETFEFMDIKQIMSVTFVSLLLFVAIGQFVAGVSGKVSAGNIGGILVIFSYVLGFLSELVEESLQWFRFFSPFKLLNGDTVLAMETETIVAIAVMLAIISALIFAGGLVYSKRDMDI